MLSRVADSIYWMKHYVERVENVARFINVNALLMIDLLSGVEQQWEPLAEITGDTPTFRNSAERRLGQLAAYLDYTVMDEVILDGLHEFLDDLQARLNEVGNAIQKSFFPLRPANPT